MSLPPLPPDADPLLQEIWAIASRIDLDELEAEVSATVADPAFVSLVDRAVAPYAHVLTPEGLAEARETATASLAGRSDIRSLMEQERARVASGTRGTGPASAEVRKQGSGDR